MTRPSSTRPPLDPATLAALIDTLAVRTPHCRGERALALGVVDADNTFVRGYGRVRDGSPQAPDAATMFEIGSITKVFTSLLLADMAGDGLVALEDELAAYVPPGASVPVKDGRHIRLVDLATHTSGLPVVPRAGVRSGLSGLRGLDPRTRFTDADLLHALSSARLRYPPGRRFAYSNMGVALLGQALARRAGTDYQTLLRDRLTGPLGMADTSVSLTGEQAGRLAQGHSFAGRRRSQRELDAFDPAGALCSCVEDMLLFLRANLSPSETSLGQAIRSTQSPRSSVGRHHQIGLGWMISVQPRSLHLILWHSGGTGGYRSFAAFVPKAKVAVVALGAQARSVDGLCLKLLEHLTTRPRRVVAG